MIVGAALLVLLGLGFFVGGILTGTTALYWACVAVCVVAAVLLVMARQRLAAPAAKAPAAAAEPSAPASTDPVASATPVAAGSAPAEDTDSGEKDPAEKDAGATPTGATAASPQSGSVAPAELPDPPVEEVEVTDLLLVVDLKDEVLVIDEHPRYHLAGCAHLAGRTTIPLPLDEARTDGFTPCAVCAPDRNLAQRARQRKHSTGA
jgi:hypothetical protein